MDCDNWGGVRSFSRSRLGVTLGAVHANWTGIVGELNILAGRNRARSDGEVARGCEGLQGVVVATIARHPGRDSVHSRADGGATRRGVHRDFVFEHVDLQWQSLSGKGQGYWEQGTCVLVQTPRSALTVSLRRSPG